MVEQNKIIVTIVLHIIKLKSKSKVVDEPSVNYFHCKLFASVQVGGKN